MNAVLKVSPWIAISLLAATSVFGQEKAGQEPQLISTSSELADASDCAPACTPVQPMCHPFICKPQRCGNVQETQMPLNPAYNAPAEINIGLMGDWNIFTSVSYLYWQALQDDMRIGTEGSQSVATFVGPGTRDKAEVIDLHFDYKSAFQVAMGMNFHNDDWVGYVEYTRFHGTDHVSRGVPNSNPTLYNLWGDDALSTTLNGTAVFNDLSALFGFKLDFIDAQLERVYYVGQKLIFHSVFGLRWASILEKLYAFYSYNGNLINNQNARVAALPGTLEATHRTSSWGIGPRFGMEMDWLMRYGFRFFGSAFADILYTSYNIQTKSVTMPFTSAFTPFTAGNAIYYSTHDHDKGMLRTHLDFDLGLGWGRYFDYNNYHVDFSASYGFQVFFNQNMLRLPEYSPSNLYVQGLTCTARLDY